MFTYPDFFAENHPLVPCIFKILHPLTPTENYFECKITYAGVRCAIGIGVARRGYPLTMYPGWGSGSIGYHADDGIFHGAPSLFGQQFGPTCTTGDRMGCGVAFEDDDYSDYVNIFFTKNGQQVGNFVKFKKPKSGLYPLIGMVSRGEQFQYLGCWNHLPKGGTIVHVILLTVLPC